MRLMWGSLVCFISAPVLAQAIHPLAGERLSDWLLRQPATIEYPIGLQWQVPQERPNQAQLKATLIDLLAAKSEMHALKVWLEAQAVTGRVILQSADARWLQANPSQNPLLATDHGVVTIPRPKTITVLLADGRLCQVLHASGATAKKYLEVCQPMQNNPRAWVAQPDGRVRSFGIAAWNAEGQDELAPGAWLWAPDPKLGLSNAFSDGLIRFLASLGAMPDANQHRAISAPIQLPNDLLRTPQYSASDWGEIGLIQTPSARMERAGTLRVNVSKVLPYTRNNLMLQPFDWLETGFRYTDIGNRAYDDTGTLHTGQTLKDKSLDFKLKLYEESSYLPAIAMGMRDIGGTGLFSSEYVIASKRFGDLDASLGIGWGYMASSGNISNPLGKLSSAYYSRPNATSAQGGEIGFQAMFKGPAAVFGGVQWRASDVLTYKIEREGNNYQKEPVGNNLPAKSLWNVAANYRYSPLIDVSAGLERGNKWMIGVTIRTNLDEQNSPKLLNPAPIAYQPTGTAVARSREHLAQEIFSQTGWQLISYEEVGAQAMLSIKAGAGAGMQRRERMDRLNALMQSHARSHIKRWNVVFIERGLTIAALEVDRDIWVSRHTQPLPPSMRKDAVTPYEPSKVVATAQKSRNAEKLPEAFNWGIGPSYSHILGGPDAFYLFRLGAAANASYRFGASTWAEGVIDYRALDNFDQFKYTGPSSLPRVRTFAREYATSTRVTIPQLQITHVTQPTNDQFASVYAGLLESMFAGVGGEWLYRPVQSTFAFGIDMNRVQQRDFNQRFAMRDYKVNTGHATAYWDTGISDILVTLQMGQYLAGDRGATIDVSRQFNNGMLLGAFATKTNVSAAQFGEGSFDKGIYVTFPFDVMLPKYNDRSATVSWQPLTRDGGARLARATPLYHLTSGRDAKTFQIESPPSASEIRARSDQHAFETPIALQQELTGESLTGSVVGSVGYATRQLLHPQSIAPWGWGAAAIISASLLDRKADDWAMNHANLNRVAKVGNALPLLLGVGALATLPDNGFGLTVLKSGGIALAASTALRTAIGRSRPEDGVGSGSFHPFGAGGVKSGFPSNHVTAAFALATPLAQNYDMPWLYGLATITAIGRVQSRQHWLSDTVAGGVLGYAVGSVLMDEYKERGRGQITREFLASPGSVGVRWRW